jgi:hypothetical protein
VRDTDSHDRQPGGLEIGRQCARPLRPRLSLGVTLPGRHQPEAAAINPAPAGPALGSHRRLARVPMPGSNWRQARHAPDPCSRRGRPPSGPPGAEGTVLICPCAAGRRGLPDGGFNSVYGGSTRWARPPGRKLPTAAGGCRRAVPRWAPRDAAAAVRPWPRGVVPADASFSAGHRLGCAAGWHCRLSWPARCRPGSVVLA